MRTIPIFIILLFGLLNIIKSQGEKDIFEQNKNLRFCGAGLQNHEIKISSVISEKHKYRKLSTVFDPIRILLDTYTLENQVETDSDLSSIKNKIPYIKEAMNTAVDALSALLRVEDYGPDIFGNDLNDDFLEKFKIHKNETLINDKNNITADLIIFAKFAESGEFPEGVLASAVPLLLYKETNRPIVGLLSLSRSGNYSYNNFKEYFSVVFLHELTHALGFLESMFPFFPQGKDNILMKKVIRGITRTLIKTPKVVERAKKYFNCKSLEGLELEDQGGPGSSISHWEQRVLLGEYMGAVIYQEEMAISEFTLAFLEDSGWYQANYYTGGLFRFGKHRGCGFIENDCLDNNYKTKFKTEFVNYNNLWTGSCSTGRQSRTYATISYYYQFDSYLYDRLPKYNGYKSGGSIYTTDYCPTNGQLADEVGQNYFYGNCKLGSKDFGTHIYYINSADNNNVVSGKKNSDLPDEIKESISDNSFCIMTNLVPEKKYKMYNSVFHPMCYETFCSSKSLTIKIKDLYIVCPRGGGNVKVEGFDGFLSCPDYNLICTGTVLCNDIFDCINKKSLPKEESFNYDYTPLTTLQNDELLYADVFTPFELSNDGKCRQNCYLCSDSDKCLKERSSNNGEKFLKLPFFFFIFHCLYLLYNV